MKGTSLDDGDLIGTTGAQYAEIVESFRVHAELAGFSRLRSPLLEEADLVERIAGPRQTFTVSGSRGQAPLALSPGTHLSAVRAFISYQPPVPWKVWSVLPRLALTSSGTVVQHLEVGLHAVGSTDPDLLAEMITVGVDALRGISIINPTVSLPKTDGDQSDIERIKADLSSANIDYLVTHPTETDGFDMDFEVQSAKGETLLAGGTYGLEVLAGYRTKGVGLIATIDDLIEAMGPGKPCPRVEVFVCDMIGGSDARDLTRELRLAGLAADRAFDDRSLRAQMKAADRSGAAFALLIGEAELAEGRVSVHFLRDNRDQISIGRDEIVARLQKLIVDGAVAS